MNDRPSPDPVQKPVQEMTPDEPRSTDATGPYVSQAATRPEVQPTPPPAGSPTIPGYVITGIIAKGGMGVVYAAQDLKFDREVAIKLSLPGSHAERFITEAKITARLPHPGIPPVHDLGALKDGGDEETPAMRQLVSEWLG